MHEPSAYEERVEAGLESVASYRDFFSDEKWPATDCPDDSERHSSDLPSGGDGGHAHEVDVCYPPGQYEGNEERYELECNVCDYIGAADTAEEAQAIARLHEHFVATLVANWQLKG